MKSYEEFCRSNILHVILKYHNEGGSRDVERLTRMAYDEYTQSPQLRHIENYYLSEIIFFPPKLMDPEQRHLDRHGLPDCYVDLGTDANWCLKTERYLLQKIKRNDERENSVLASSHLFLRNREPMIYKYCRNKFQEAREQKAQEKENEEKIRARKLAKKSHIPGPKSKTRKPTIKDFFPAQAMSPQKAKLKRKTGYF